MVSDDKDRDISGRKDKLEIQADQVNDDLSYDADDATSDIEQELERAMADSDDSEAVEEIDFNVTKEKKSGSVGKFIAPVLVLAIAAGAAGYIVMHPEIINRENWGLSAPVATATTPAESGEIKLAQADLSETLPQPTATQNDTAPAAGAPEAAPAADPIAPVTPAPDATAAAPAPAQTPPVEAPATETSAATPSAPAAEAPKSETPPAPAAEVSKDSAAEADKLVPAPEAPKDEIKLAQAETPAAPPALSAPTDTKLAVPVGDATLPDPGKLKDVTPPPISPTQGAKADAAAPPPIVPPVAEKPAKASDAYYDSNAGVPSASKSGSTPGPRKVDPNIEPGQKFVVVSGVRNASDSESMIVAAGRALKLGRYDAALEMYDALYAKNKRDPRILMGRAVAQQNLGKDDAAINSYRELLDLDPDATDALANMLGLLKKQEPATALQRMMDMAKRYPANAGLAAQIGIAQGEMGNYPEAFRYLNMAATLDPSNPQHPFNMAVLADRQGNVADAIKFYEQALQANAISGGSRSSVPKEAIYDRLSTLRGK